MKKQNKRSYINSVLLCLGIIYVQTIMIADVIADDYPVLKVKVISSTEILTCEEYSDGALKSRRDGGSGPINNPTVPTGQYFDYELGRLYYRSCYLNFGEVNEESFGFVEWESKDGKTKTIVTLLKKPGFCFRGSSFNIIKSNLVVTLSTCDGKKNKEGFSYLNMTYSWKGDNLGNGMFKLKNEIYKKDF